MKSNVPWSIKGIDPDARNVAKKAARAAGMTLGEWINQQIMDVEGKNTGDSNRSGSDNQGALAPNVVTIDQLREVVYSLNRMNDRLKTTERDSIQAFSGINQGLTSVLDRIRKVEEHRETGIDPAIADRLAAVEQDTGSRKYVDSFVALESALRSMVNQLETTREETMARVSATETAISKLDNRLSHIDAQGAAALERMREHVDQVSEQLRKTEATSRALMLEARAASSSDDQAFVERTTNKLRILGTEIKRSGDQIQALEGHIQKLSDKIEGAEQRSAQGINMLSDRLATMSSELTDFDREQAEVTRSAHEVITETTRTAHNRMNDLEGSFEKMITRLEGVVDGEQAFRDMVTEETEAEAPDAGAEADDKTESPLQQAIQEAESDLPGEEDFDEVFGDALDDEPEATTEANEPVSEDPLFASDDDNPDDFAAPESGDGREPKLTAKQKVILAARARRKRIEREAQIRTENTEPELDDEPESYSDEEPDQAPTNKISQLREKYARSGSRLPMMIGLIVGFAIIVVIGWFLLQGNQSSAISAIDADSTSTSVAPELTAAEQFSRWQTLSASATTEEESNRALMILRRAAGRDYPPAQYALAELYRTGASGEADPVMARNWFQASAEGGNIDAMHKLGSMFASGIGGPVNESTAISWFEQASAYGYVDSIFNLALIYDPAVDLGTESTEQKSADKAYYWYAIAAKLGDEEANADALKLGLIIAPESRRSLDAQVDGWQPRTPIPTAN